MSELKTKLFVPEFYLISKDKKIKLSGEGSIGRSKGDIQIKDEKLSSLHCKFLVRGTKIFITDLNSTNGVFVNSQKIEPDIETGLNIGDKVRLGSNEFVLFDEDQSLSQDEEIRSLSWKDIFSLKNLNTVYGASIWWRFLYVLLLFFPAFMLLEGNYAVDSKLLFLEPLIDGADERNLGLFILSGFVFASIHAYDAKYRRRGVFLKSVFFCFFFVVNFFIAIAIYTAFIDYEVREYLDERNAVVNNKRGIRLTQSFERHYRNIKSHLSKRDAEAFEKDYLHVIASAIGIQSDNYSKVISCQLVKDLFKETADEANQARPKILEQITDNKFNCPESLVQYFIDNKGSADEGISGFLSDIYLLDAPMVLDWVSKDGELQSKLESGLANAFYEKRELSAEELSLAFVGNHPEVIKEDHKHYHLAKQVEFSVFQYLKEEHSQ